MPDAESCREGMKRCFSQCCPEVVIEVVAEDRLVDRCFAKDLRVVVAAPEVPKPKLFGRNGRHPDRGANMSSISGQKTLLAA